MKKIYVDTETCGLHSMPVLIQYAVGNGPVVLYDIWLRPIGETLDLIEWLMENTLIFFNAAFDMYHLCKCYTIFCLCPREWIPKEHIDEIAMLEPKGQDGPCLKPRGTLDLMLHSRKGPYQALMARDDVRIRRVPNALAYALAAEMETRVEIDGIFFAKRAVNDAPRWNIFDRKKDGEFDPNFKDVVLRFSPAGGLKFLAEYALNKKPEFHYKDVEPDRAWRPYELGYAPTALAVTSCDWEVDGKHSWPGVIAKFIDHWANNENARKYAELDIVYTRALDEHFNYPEPDDDDSTLACMVAAVRWHGFKINIPGIQALQKDAQAIVAASPVNCNKPPDVRAYIYECMDEMEKIILETSTKKANLEAVSHWQVTEDEECSKCEGIGCSRCDGGSLKKGQHPAAKRAAKLLAIKVAAKEVELYTKLLRAGKFHASFKVIGTLSSRMSGADGLNPQGIKSTDSVRSMFPLAWEDMELSIGDFDSFEVTIADAVCDDPDLRADLLSGKKIHATFGSMMFPEYSYDEISATKGTSNDLYSKGKQGFFATILYGGTYQTLMNKLGVLEENAKSAIDQLLKKYKKVGGWRARVFKSFCSMSQPGGIGTQVVWRDPADYCETALGFRRYFTLENKICKALFNLARKPPKKWKECPVKVVRRDRVQTAGGAVTSALYGAAFGVQAASMRAAANHEIQGAGSGITKYLERKLWDLQPSGVNPWVVAPMQIHDEVAIVHSPDMANTIKQVVQDTVVFFKGKVPLLEMDWHANVSSWADK